MIDCFELGFDDAPKPALQPARQYEVVPVGTHAVEIVAASIGDVAWKASTANPEGQCLKLRLGAGRDYGLVFVDIPRDRKWLFKALAASLGLEPGADGKVSIGPPDGLIGRHARVEIAHYTTRAGETRASVKRWLPAERQPVAPTSRPVPARTQSVKAAAEFRASAAEDDLPF